MKKSKITNLVCLLLLTALFFGCSNSPELEPTLEPAATATQAPTPIPTPEKDMPDVIGLYIPDKAAGIRQLVTEYRSDWIQGQDIKCFEAFATRENTISGGQFGEVWRSYWNSYADADLCKIGYCLYFTLKDGTSAAQIIKSPEDTLQYKTYIETYLYDDANQQPGVWYSHLETADMGDGTACTSIKLTAGAEIDKVEEIQLETFVYSGSDDFDPQTGAYTGSVSYRISIVRNDF